MAAGVPLLADHHPADQQQMAEVEAHFRSASKKLGRSYFVIDCDRHIIEPPEAFTRYLDPQWCDQAPRLVRDNRGAPRLMIEGCLADHGGPGHGAGLP
ncbi:hypothetical protein NZK33_10030 [Cyanobium sp. FGCU-6]|nr:hypothetical protein [Cyanobium sp. FGCU6]